MKHSTKNQTISDRKDVAESRITFGLESASALHRAFLAEKTSDKTLSALQARLITCSDRENHFVAEDLHNAETGELHAGNGTLWACGLRLCTSCSSKISAKARKELKFALLNQKLLCGENYLFITTTMPNCGLSFIATRELFYRAIELLQKRDYIKDRIRGYSKNEEFTLTESGFHYHGHFLAISRFLSFDKFRAIWTECVEKAFREKNVPFEVNTKDGYLIVKVERLSSSKQSLDKAIQEVSKYVTKSDSWEKLEGATLLEIASLRRFPRMFELHGCFRTQREFNKFQNTFLFYLILQLIIEQMQRQIECGYPVTIVHTKEISHGEQNFLIENKPENVPKNDRSLSWRDYVEVFGLESYLEHLAEQAERTREWRKRALRLKYPYADFQTLDGKEF